MISMVVNLDKIDLSRADPDGMEKSLTNYCDMCLRALELAESFAVPSYLIKCKKILFLGMGASGIIGEFFKDLMIDSSVMVNCIHDYNIPGWVDKETLVIAVSHSGDTEEVLYTFVSAFQKNAKLLAVTTGGKLNSLCSKYRVPVITYDFDSDSKLAFPYQFIIPYIVLKKLGYLELTPDEFSQTLDLLNSQKKKIEISSHLAVNPAKDIALKIINDLVFITSSSVLRSSGMRFAHSINVDAKSFAAFSFLPEINHNFVSGLEAPKDLIKKMTVMMIESKFARMEIKKRQNITAQYLSSKRINYMRLDFPQSVNHFCEIILSVHFLEYIGMYMGFLNQTNPASSKAVELIKSELSKE